MFRALKVLVTGVFYLTIVAIAGALLFWLGRTQPPPAEVVFGDEDDLYDDDDPGEDVDE